jgi:hypothetical protein
VSIPKSGYFIPNRYARLFLQSLEDVMGKNGVSAVLNLVGLPAWVEAYPSDDLERQVDFADFSAINGALEEMYGPRGGRGMERRAAWATVERLIRRYRPVAWVVGLFLRSLPARLRLRFGLQALARLLTQTSDEECTWREEGTAFLFTAHRCAVCWGRVSDRPVCSATVGLLEQLLRWASTRSDFHVQETRCISVGDRVCEFRIERLPPG